MYQMYHRFSGYVVDHLDGPAEEVVPSGNAYLFIFNGTFGFLVQTQGYCGDQLYQMVFGVWYRWYSPHG